MWIACCRGRSRVSMNPIHRTAHRPPATAIQNNAARQQFELIHRFIDWIVSSFIIYCKINLTQIEKKGRLHFVSVVMFGFIYNQYNSVFVWTKLGILFIIQTETVIISNNAYIKHSIYADQCKSGEGGDFLQIIS